MELVPSFAQRTGLPFAPFKVLWVPSSARLVALGATSMGASPARGGLQVYKLEVPADGEAGQLRLVLDSPSALPSGLKCGTFDLSDEDHQQRLLAVGDFEGRVRVWDVDRVTDGLPQPVFTVELPHKQIINSIAALPPNLLLTGSRDGRACVWDIRQASGAVAELAFPENDCWAVTFGPSDTGSFFAGYDDGMVYLADMRMNATPRWQHHLVRSSGICSLAYSDAKLLATTVDDQFALFDLDAAVPKPIVKHHHTGRPSLRPAAALDATTWDVKFCPHNPSLFMTSAGNGYLDLYKTKPDNGRTKVECVATSAPSNQPIISFDWNKSKEGLFALSSLNDNSIRVGFVPTPLR